MKSLSSKHQGLVAINIAAILFGTAGLFGKLNVSPYWIVAMRAVFAFITLFALGLYQKQLERVERSLLRGFMITGILLAIHWLTFFMSVQWSGIPIATLTFAAFPMFTLFIEKIRQRKQATSIELIATACILFAVYLIVDIDFRASKATIGALVGLSSALSFACFGIISKDLGKHVSPLLVSLYQNAVVALILSPFLFFVSSAPQHAHEWLWLMMLGIVTTALMHQLYLYSLKRLSATTCSGFVALEPIYAIVFARIFFHETITQWVVLSGILILLASYILLKQEH